MGIRTLIVEDGPTARAALAEHLKLDAEIDVVGQCGDSRQAIFAIGRLKPELVFLAVQMRELDGFSVIEAIGPEQMPLPIFLTAYDRQVLSAFEAHDLDFLVKPLTTGQLQGVLQRAKTRLRTEPHGEGRGRLVGLLHDIRAHPRHVERVMLRSRGRIVFVRTSEIDWIQAEGNYVRIRAGDAEHLLRGTMRSLEARLDPKEFVRIHRSTIVRIDRIKELQPWPTGEYVVRLHSGKEMTLSRGYRDSLRVLLQGESLFAGADEDHAAGRSAQLPRNAGEP
ncbi:MAG TPA: LytTR family DNA-binding domain-containing protein [Terriglobales bacterium]|nr:LytTR family DNA-binding domain-containing protein [Terriglobales bacterium]